MHLQRQCYSSVVRVGKLVNEADRRVPLCFHVAVRCSTPGVLEVATVHFTCDKVAIFVSRVAQVRQVSTNIHIMAKILQRVAMKSVFWLLSHPDSFGFTQFTVRKTTFCSVDSYKRSSRTKPSAKV